MAPLAYDGCHSCPPHIWHLCSRIDSPCPLVSQGLEGIVLSEETEISGPVGDK
jgi:hypothetical protein